MATQDQGGLNWKLNVTDGFTGPLEQFTTLVRQAKAAMDAFKGDKNAFTASVDQMKALTELTRAQTAATREQRTQQTQADREALQQQRELAAAIKQRAQAEKERGAIIRAQKADQEAAARAALALDSAIAKGNASIKNTGDEAGKGAPKVRGLTTQLNAMRQALVGGSAAGNRLVFTLRNIIGVGAGLVFIQKIQQGFSDLVRSGIGFNAEVENTTVGIAGLLSAVVDVKDAQGNLLTGAEAFNATQEVAVGQVEKLRQATLRTTATFEQLADTFQIAVAPGLKAGLDIDQIRELAISVSQAAGALGVPTNQLSEEIRALLTGTIQARTTRIATALGIRPEDIARAKNEVGGLAKFLDDRFRAFELAGERAAGTFTGTFNRARTAISLVAGDASKDLFEEIRQSFLTVFDSFTRRDVFGNLMPDPRAVQVLRAVFNGIGDAVRTIRTNLQQLSFDQVLTSAESIGSVFRGIGQVLSGFITGAIAGFSTLSRIFRELFGSSPDLTNMAARLGEIVTVVGVIGVAFSGVRLVISTLILPLTAVISTIGTLASTMRALGLTNPFILLLASATALFFVLKDLQRQQEIVNQTFEASKPENQLSKAAQLQGKLNELLRNHAALQKKINDEDAKGDPTQGAGLFSRRQQRDEIRLAQLGQMIVETRKLIEIQNEADKLNPGAGAPKPKVDAPEFDQNSLIERVTATASNIVNAFQTAFAGKPVDVPVQPKLEPVELGDFPDVFAEAEERLKKKAELSAKVGLDKYGEALQRMADQTEGALNLMRSAVTEFSSFVADSIVDAFDPSNDVSFKERFARFLQSMAKQIIATLTQIAIAKILLSIGVGAAGGTTVAAEGGLVEGFAEGGPVQGPSATPNHFGIKAPRPKGLDPTDTIPAWLAPGEFVHRASAVARYGADAMDALNKGLVDPMQLRGLLGLGSRYSRDVKRARRIAGFADGGLIAGQVAASAAAQTDGLAAPAAAAGPMPAFIVGNDHAVDRFLRGGKAAFMDFARENASTLKAILGQ